MLLVDVIQERATLSSALNLASLEKEPKLSFTEYLKGINLKTDDKIIQNGAFVLAVHNNHEKVFKENVQTINKDSLLSLLKTDEMPSPKEGQVLELNQEITQNLSVTELKNLISSAKKYLKEKIFQSEGFKQSQIQELPHTLKGLAQLAKKIGIDISKITIENVQSKQAQSLQEETPLKLQSDVKELKSTSLEQVQTNNTKKIVAVKLDQKNKVVQIVEETKRKTPLFKAQVPSEHTTEQLVASKQFKLEEKTPKKRVDETLKLLLRSEGSDTQSNSKIEGISVLKAESFEVKLIEAKQMIKYLSTDVKNAIQDYKSPFTRLKVQLNPQKLGAIDLTIVQRGKNLHINLNSNATAISTLSMNVNELKVQLANNGINSASLNFNTNSQGDSSNAQQQQRQNEQNANKEYTFFHNEETNEEIVSSLEIVVPNYA